MRHDPQDLAQLTDAELLETLARCTHATRQALAQLLRHLAELDRRRLYLGRGYPSLFAYVVQALHFSEDEAYRRIQSARVAARFPEIFAMLDAGELHLSGLSLLAPHLDEENHRARLAAAVHKSKREIEALVAIWSPRPDAVTRLARLPERVAGAVSAQPPSALFAAARPETTPAKTRLASLEAQAPLGAFALHTNASAPLQESPPAAPRSTLHPLAADRYRLQVTLSGKAHAALERARRLMRPKNPSGDLSVLLEQALELLAEDLQRRRFGKRRSKSKSASQSAADSESQATAKAAESKSPAPAQVGAKLHHHSRHVPLSLRRAVAERDGDCCAYQSPDGRRCRATQWLEIHHIQPFALGGAHTLENLSLRCRAHNAYEGELEFGPRERPARPDAPHDTLAG